MQLKKVVILLAFYLAFPAASFAGYPQLNLEPIEHYKMRKSGNTDGYGNPFYFNSSKNFSGCEKRHSPSHICKSRFCGDLTLYSDGSVIGDFKTFKGQRINRMIGGNYELRQTDYPHIWIIKIRMEDGSILKGFYRTHKYQNKVFPTIHAGNHIFKALPEN